MSKNLTLEDVETIGEFLRENNLEITGNSGNLALFVKRDKQSDDQIESNLKQLFSKVNRLPTFPYFLDTGKFSRHQGDLIEVQLNVIKKG